MGAKGHGICLPGDPAAPQVPLSPLCGAMERDPLANADPGQALHLSQ